MKTLSIMGRVGHPPRLKRLDSGDHMLTMQVAVTEPVQVGGAWKDETTWIDVILFGARAKYLAARLVKGEAVACSGEMYVRHYQGRDMRDKTRIELRATRVDPCAARADDAGRDVGEQTRRGGKHAEDEDAGPAL